MKLFILFLGITALSLLIIAGPQSDGLITLTAPSGTSFAIDTGVIPYFVSVPPKELGPCVDLKGEPLGSAAMAKDETGLYFCVFDSSGTLMWRKVPVLPTVSTPVKQ